MIGALLVVLAVVIAVAFMIAGWWIGLFNTFKIGKTDIETQWSNLRAEYQRRADLILNVAASVKGYALHEKKVLIEVAKARGGFGANKQAERAKMAKVDGVFAGLMTYVENYPNIKANESFKQLMEELRITEDRINIARTDYNELVRQYNINVRTFPSNIVAQHYAFSEEHMFESEAGAEKAPKLDFAEMGA